MSGIQGYHWRPDASSYPTNEEISAAAGFEENIPDPAELERRQEIYRQFSESQATDDRIEIHTNASPEPVVVYGDGESAKPAYNLHLQMPQTEQGKRALAHAARALELFITKNNGYGEPDGEDLGSQGQFADMHRKWKLLRKHLWDRQPWTHHEPIEMVVYEMIGHLLLTADFLQEGK